MYCTKPLIALPPTKILQPLALTSILCPSLSDLVLQGGSRWYYRIQLLGVELPLDATASYEIVRYTVIINPLNWGRWGAMCDLGDGLCLLGANQLPRSVLTYWPYVLQELTSGKYKTNYEFSRPCHSNRTPNYRLHCGRNVVQISMC